MDWEILRAMRTMRTEGFLWGQDKVVFSFQFSESCLFFNILQNLFSAAQHINRCSCDDAESGLSSLRRFSVASTFLRPPLILAASAERNNRSVLSLATLVLLFCPSFIYIISLLLHNFMFTNIAPNLSKKMFFYFFCLFLFIFQKITENQPNPSNPCIPKKYFHPVLRFGILRPYLCKSF